MYVHFPLHTFPVFYLWSTCIIIIMPKSTYLIHISRNYCQYIYLEKDEFCCQLCKKTSCTNFIPIFFTSFTYTCSEFKDRKCASLLCLSLRMPCLCLLCHFDDILSFSRLLGADQINFQAFFWAICQLFLQGINRVFVLCLFARGIIMFRDDHLAASTHLNIIKRRV